MKIKTKMDKKITTIQDYVNNHIDEMNALGLKQKQFISPYSIREKFKHFGISVTQIDNLLRSNHRLKKRETKDAFSTYEILT